MFAEWLLMYVTKTSFIQSEVARSTTVDDAQIGQPYLMNARLESTLQTDGISAITDQFQVLPLIAMPLAEVLLCRRDRKSNQQDKADNSEGSDRIGEECRPCRGEDFSYLLHSTPPRPHPGPSWAAEECADRGEHN